MRAFCTLLLGAAALLETPKAARGDVRAGIQFVPIGNPGNANDTTGFGGVSYSYQLSAYDVTVTQYTAFLNAVAATTDLHSLYNPSMASDLNSAGISRTAITGGFHYTAIPGSENHPVTYVSWFDAARFTNWLQNGQLTGALGAASTETGAYTLGPQDSGTSFTKSLGAQFWIPSQNEWYKGAYYDPNKNGGAGGYWTYPTKSNSVPGNVVGGAANQANYIDANSRYSATQNVNYSTSQNYLTDVGAFTNSASAYGTYDQGGDVNQWTDAASGSNRGVRGGAWNSGLSGFFLQSPNSGTFVSPLNETNDIGFRVAALIPEPSATVSFILAGGILLARRRRPSAV